MGQVWKVGARGDSLVWLLVWLLAVSAYDL